MRCTFFLHFFSKLLIVLLFGVVPLTRVAAAGSDPEDYKFKFNAHWWIARPSGSIQGDTGPIDFQKDFNFGNYNTFYGFLEWKPRRKHHILCYIAPNRSSSDHVLGREIEFHEQTFFVNEKVHAELQSFLFSPGYEYDILSRPRGHLGIDFLVNLFDWKARITTQGGVVLPDGTVSSARSASKTAFLPLPTGGPTGLLSVTIWCQADSMSTAQSRACISSGTETSSLQMASWDIRLAIT